MYKTAQQVKDKHTTAGPTASVHIVPGQVVFASIVSTKTRKEEKSFLSFVFLYRIPFIYCISSHYKQNTLGFQENNAAGLTQDTV